jgi:hypothetical protein
MRPVPHPASLAALVLASAACAIARPAPPPGPPPLDPGRAAAEVRWLADPARGGRAAGSPGGEAAIAWIEARFAEAGLVPAGDQGFRQPLEVPVRATLGQGNALALAGAPSPLGVGWLPFGFSDDGAVEGELVWAGHGITAPDLGHDDYAGLDVTGKVVLVAGDTPGEADPASPFRDPSRYHYGEWRTKAATARDHGAAAVLMVRDAWQHAGDDALPAWRGTVSSRAGIVAARVTGAALSAAGVDAAALAGGPSRPLGITASLTVAVIHERARTANLLGLVPGNDPAVAGECVVVGAHHDHLGLGGDSSLAPDLLGTVHPGADDNASGVAALLAVARAAAAGPAPRRTLLLAAFAAEELGVLGSAWLVTHAPAACPVERMQLMVNLDMVGRPQGGRLYVHGVDTARGLRDRVAELAARPPATPFTLAWRGDGYGPSDQTSFYARGVPVLFLFTGAHLDYHRPSDTAGKVDGAAVAEVARLAWRLAEDAAEAPARLEVVRTPPPAGSGPGRERGYGAYLGTIPDFGEREAPGVMLTGVRPGSPAERAGIAGGDVLVRIDATRVVGLPDLATALRSHRPGDVIEVELERQGARRTVHVTLGERSR